MKAWPAPSCDESVCQSFSPGFHTTTSITWLGRTHHGLAGQLEVGHRDSNLLVVMLPGHDFYHITFLFSPLGEAEHGQSQQVLHLILFLYLQGERAGMARELTAKGKTVHSDRIQDSQTSPHPPQA